MATLCYTFSLFFLFLPHLFYLAISEPFIGFNLGPFSDNLPTPEATAKLLRSTSIQKLRLYAPNAAIIKALANTTIGIILGTTNRDIPALGSDFNFAKKWVAANVAPFYPSSNIILLTVGNEVTSSGDLNLLKQLLPAMHNLQNALNAASLGGKIKVSTTHSMSVLKQWHPPSSGSFDQSLADLIKGILGFYSANGSPFMFHPYPFYAFKSDPRPDVLAFALFQAKSGQVDSATKLTYTNMFDAQVDAVRSAINSMGFKNVGIVAAATGWPHRGDNYEAGANVENAKAYIGNLLKHLRSKVGTPLMPGKSVDTYLYAMYDENLKPGPGSERAFGLFKPDLTMNYDAGLSKKGQIKTKGLSKKGQVKTNGLSKKGQTPLTPKTPATPSSPMTVVRGSKLEVNAAAWCVPYIGTSDTQLQSNLDYACRQGIDCSPVQPGGSCFEPNTLFSHAAYAMNLYFQTHGRNPWNCDFSQTAAISVIDPSYSGCTYPGVSSNITSPSQTNKTSSTQKDPVTPSTPKTPVTPSTPTTVVRGSKLETNAKAWCVPIIGTSDTQLQSNLDYACRQGIDCGPIQPGGACFEPNTLFSHAAYAMNLYFQTHGRNPWNCNFSQTAAISVIDPSFSGCAYPGVSSNGTGPSQTNKISSTQKDPVTPSMPKTPVTPSTPTAIVRGSKLETNAKAWCVPKIGTSDAQLQSNLDYACKQGIDCGPIQPGGACFEPNTLFSHAAYVMNLYFQTHGRNPWDCNFTETAAISVIDPSYKGCTYPGVSK